MFYKYVLFFCYCFLLLYTDDICPVSGTAGREQVSIIAVERKNTIQVILFLLRPILEFKTF